MIQCIQVLSSAELGGGELVGINLAKGLNAMGLKTDILVPGLGPAHNESVSNGLHTIKYPGKLAVNSNLLLASLSILYTALILRGYSIPIIHCHSPLVYKALYRAFHWRRNSLNIVHVHTEIDKYTVKWALTPPPHVIIVCASFIENQIRNALPHDRQEIQRIEVVPNAVDTKRFHPGDSNTAKRGLGLNPNTPMVLMVADLGPHKGHETIIKALAYIKKKGIFVNCWFVGKDRSGTGNYELKLRELINELELNEYIYFAGYRSDVPLLMQAADCMVLPSKSEGLPLCILEAQASGLPVIATPLPGIQEVITDNVTGFLICNKNHKEYAKKILTLIYKKDISQYIAQNSLDKCIKSRSFDHYLNKIFSIYSSSSDQLNIN